MIALATQMANARSSVAGRGSHGTAHPPWPPLRKGGKGFAGAAVGAADGRFAYVMRCACPPGPDGTRGGTVVDHVRLFPIRPGVRWTYRVHEQILPSLNRAKIPVRWTDIVIRHDGYADPDVEARKLERNIKILERELIERPDDPFVLFNLGVECRAAKGLSRRARAAGTQPGPFGATRLDRAQALCVDRSRAPDDRQFARGTADVRRRFEARPSRCRVVAPQGGHSSPSWRIVRGRAIAGGGFSN